MQHVIKALLKKNAGKATDKIARTLQGPLLSEIKKNGKSYKPKPLKIGRKLDDVQHEANAVEYVNTKGERGQGELDFMDESGRTFYMNKSGDNLQYSDRTIKKGNNSKLSGRRATDEEVQTLPHHDTRDFYKKGIPGTEAHHIAGLDQYGWLYDGLDQGDQMALSLILEDAGIPVGNNPFNRADLSTGVHKKLHQFQSAQGFSSRKNAPDISSLSLKERQEYVQRVIAEHKASMKEMFRLRQEENFGTEYISLAGFHDAYESATRPELYYQDISQKRSTSARKAA